MNYVFLSGIHGVGKTTIGKRLENELQLKCYTASALIEHGIARGIIVLVDDVSKIAERNHDRGDRLSSEEFLRDFQQAEVDYGEVIGQLLQIPVQISKNDEAGFKDILSFLRQMEEKEDERDPFVNKAGIC